MVALQLVIWKFGGQASLPHYSGRTGLWPILLPNQEEAKRAGWLFVLDKFKISWGFKTLQEPLWLHVLSSCITKPCENAALPLLTATCTLCLRKCLHFHRSTCQHLFSHVKFALRTFQIFLPFIILLSTFHLSWNFEVWILMETKLHN